jgi:hypothetical protein
MFEQAVDVDARQLLDNASTWPSDAKPIIKFGSLPNAAGWTSSPYSSSRDHDIVVKTARSD